jgi:hypothetical protein
MVRPAVVEAVAALMLLAVMMVLVLAVLVVRGALIWIVMLGVGG